MIFDREHYINEPSPIESELRILFDESAPLTIFDIGACEGEDSIKYARLFPNATINTFEPIPQNQDRINANITKYGTKNVTLFPYALSNSVGEAVFYLSTANDDVPEHSGNWDFGNKSSSLLQPDKHLDMVKFISFNERITVKTSTIDTFCRQDKVTEIDLVHLDVQGAELMVFEGTAEMLPSIKLIWLEVSEVKLYKGQPLTKDIHRFMTLNNFTLIKSTGDAVTGDRLYVSKKYFPDLEARFPKRKEKMSPVQLIKKIIGRFQSNRQKD